MIENQRWRLAAAAGELLGEVGYRRLTMHMIAARATVAPAVAYREFADPAAILAESFRLVAANVRACIRSSCDSGKGEDPFLATAEAAGDLLTADATVRALLGPEAAVGSAEVAALRLQLFDEFSAWLSRARYRQPSAGYRLRLEGAVALLVSGSRVGSVPIRELVSLLG